MTKHTHALLGRVGLRALRCDAMQGDPPAATQLVVDISIQFDLTAVAESDSYADVVDLIDLARVVRETIGAQPRLLLETLAVHTARAVLQRFASVRKVRLRIVKPEPHGLGAAEESVEVRLSQ